MENKSADLKELFASLSLAQAELRAAVKDANNPFFKSKYADLPSVWEVARGPLTKNGLSVIQTTQIRDNGTTVLVTTLAHKSGQWIEGQYPINPVKNDPQGIGSAITYARRYALSAIVGIVSDEDDDGEHAMGRDQGSPAKEIKVIPRPAVQKPGDKQIEEAWKSFGLAAESAQLSRYQAHEYWKKSFPDKKSDEITLEQIQYLISKLKSSKSEVVA